MNSYTYTLTQAFKAQHEVLVMAGYADDDSTFAKAVETVRRIVWEQPKLRFNVSETEKGIEISGCDFSLITRKNWVI